MKTQNASNHRRLNLYYHGVLFALCLTALVVSSCMFFRSLSCGHHFHEALVLLLLSLGLLLLMFLSRSFAIKAQDRAIRAEESLRHFILTGKAINPNLRLGQIIALRFAPDEELIELTEKAVAENLKGTEIKALIKNWKADTHRV